MLKVVFGGGEWGVERGWKSPLGDSTIISMIRGRGK